MDAGGLHNQDSFLFRTAKPSLKSAVCDSDMSPGDLHALCYLGTYMHGHRGVLHVHVHGSPTWTVEKLQSNGS